MSFTKLSGYQIKYFALFSMFLDHTGFICQPFLPNTLYLVLRGVGRLAFPLFCFFLVEGFFHTKNPLNYAGRLLAFAVLSELPFDLAFYRLSSLNLAFSHQNVFFTLFLGFIAMYFLEQSEASFAFSFSRYIIVLILFSLVNEMIRGDYGGGGIFCILLFYFFRKNTRDTPFLSVPKCLLSMCPLVLSALPSFPVQAFCFGAALLLRSYNGKRGRGNKYFFYLFYPAHLLFLYGCSVFLL